MRGQAGQNQSYTAAKILTGVGIVIGLGTVAISYFYGASIGIAAVPSMIVGGLAGSILCCCCCCTGFIASACFGTSSSVSPANDVELGQNQSYTESTISTPNINSNQLVTLRSGIYEGGIIIGEVGDDNGPKPGIYSIYKSGTQGARIDFNQLSASSANAIKEAVESKDGERMWSTLIANQGRGVQIG